MDEVAIAIMAKAPIPGLAKTRLIPVLGEEGAARLQGRLLQRTVIAALAAGTGPVALWATPDQQHPDIVACQRIGSLALHAQPEGDLGYRMQWALLHGPAADATLIIGTDCPALTPDMLRVAAERLSKNDAVLVPAEDGGYALIGIRQRLRHAAPEVFTGIDWSSDKVLAQTRQRMAALHWRVVELQTLWDIDTPADYQRLCVSYPEMTMGLVSGEAAE